MSILLEHSLRTPGKEELPLLGKLYVGCDVLLLDLNRLMHLHLLVSMYHHALALTALP